MAIINYADKVALNVNASIPAINKIEAGDMNEIKNAFNNQVAQGWYKTGINPTFTFVSYDSTTLTGVVTSNVDLTTYLSVGMKVKFTQSGATKYAFITAITSTQITLFMGTDYSLNNSAISNTYYSMLKAPYGFSMQPDKWSLTLTSTSNILKDFPVQNTWYNLASLNIQIPIGVWDVDYSLYQRGYRGTSGLCKTQTSLSTSTSSGNTDFLTVVYGNPMNDIGLAVYAKQRINLSSPATYYLITRTDVTGMGDIGYDGSRQITKVRAVCAYL